MGSSARNSTYLGTMKSSRWARQWAMIDRLEVGGVVPPSNWTENMTKIIGPNLKQVHKGQMQVNGTQIAIKGNVANEALRQQVVSTLATSLNPTYTIDNGLVAAGGEAQSVLDKTLSNRVVEFEVGAATLTPAGRVILDEMYAAIKQIGTPKVQVINQAEHHRHKTFEEEYRAFLKKHMIEYHEDYMWG